MPLWREAALLLGLGCMSCVRAGFQPALDGSTPDGSTHDGSKEETCQATQLRREVTITGSAASLDGHQVRLKVPLLDGMDPAFADLSFQDQQGQVMPHWIESASGSEATVWVLVPLIPTTGTTIYMYYHRPCVTSRSDYVTTFPWRAELVVGSDDALHTTIAVDSQDMPRLAYRDLPTGYIKYASRDGSTWKVEQVDTGSHAAMGIAKDDTVHLVYFNTVDFTLKHARLTSTSVSIETVDSGDTDFGAYPGIAIDSNSFPHLSYRRGGTGELKYARWNGSTWQLQVVDNRPVACTSVSLDSLERPHLSYMLLSSMDLYYVVWTGTAWINPVLVDSNTDYPLVAIDSTGATCIAYYGADKSLKYARRSAASTTWQIDTLDTFDNKPFFLGLRLDRGDHPHISYQRESTLRYAHYDGSQWQIETIDANGTTGNDSSLALDSYGFPHIAYGTTGVGLMYATRRKTATPAPVAQVQGQ